MARIVNPAWAIRCVQSSCRALFEVVHLDGEKQQEVICPECGEHYLYPIISKDENKG